MNCILEYRVCSDEGRGTESRNIEGLAWVHKGNAVLLEFLTDTCKRNVLVSAAYEILMNLICKNNYMVFHADISKLCKFLFRKHMTSRVLRVTEDK